MNRLGGRRRPPRGASGAWSTNTVSRHVRRSLTTRPVIILGPGLFFPLLGARLHFPCSFSRRTFLSFSFFFFLSGFCGFVFLIFSFVVVCCCGIPVSFCYVVRWVWWFCSSSSFHCFFHLYRLCCLSWVFVLLFPSFSCSAHFLLLFWGFVCCLVFLVFCVCV